MGQASMPQSTSSPRRTRSRPGKPSMAEVREAAIEHWGDRGDSHCGGWRVGLNIGVVLEPVAPGGIHLGHVGPGESRHAPPTAEARTLIGRGERTRSLSRVAVDAACVAGT